MLKRRKPYNKGLLLTALIMTLFLWGTCAYLLKQSAKQLTDLTKISGTLSSISVEQSSGRAHPYYVVFNLKRSNEHPGIYFGQAEEAARKFALQFDIDDEVVIYYNAGGIKAERTINLHVYQVQKEGSVIYTLTEAQRAFKNGAWWAGGFALLFTVLLLAVFYREAVRKARVHKEIAKL